MSAMRALMLAALACAVGFACATSPALDPDPEPCTTAADCEVTGFTGCCACDGEPRAVNRQTLAKRREICTVVECKCAVADCRCPPVADPRAFLPACTHGRCQTIRR
jgi:hypothetical protein